MKPRSLAALFVTISLVNLSACGASQSDAPDETNTAPAYSEAADTSVPQDLGSDNAERPNDEEFAESAANEPDDSMAETPDVIVVSYSGPDALYATPTPEYEPPQVSMRIVSSDRNEIIDTDKWFADHPFDHRTDIPLGAPTTLMGEQFRYANGLDLSVVLYGDAHDQRYLWAEHADGPPTVMDLSALKVRWMSLTYADRRGDVIYLSHSNRSSSDAMNGENGYLTAIDAWTGDVLWQTQPLVANAITFAVIGDVLISGYGFTAEDDFLYAIDANTGQILGQLQTRKAPEYLVFDGETLFVRTYDRDLEVRVDIER